uniref:Uncharacterized protein n=1 Tax=Molossus molossus TaxID=27622 RepID=A0A7J8JVZ3_MOLMO|nr:hypothetical protein HJG59_008023 [Molossus molossus]
MGTGLMGLGVRKRQVVSSKVAGKGTRRRDTQVCVGLSGKEEKGSWGMCRQQVDGASAQVHVKGGRKETEVRQVYLCKREGSFPVPGTGTLASTRQGVTGTGEVWGKATLQGQTYRTVALGGCRAPRPFSWPSWCLLPR